MLIEQRDMSMLTFEEIPFQGTKAIIEKLTVSLMALSIS